MASKLLNVLSEIESHRKDCIDVLREKGLRAPDNASFLEISELMDELNWHVYNEDPTAPPNQIGNPWGYTLATDPYLWRRPVDWPDIETTFRTYNAFTVPYHDSDIIAVKPAAIILLKDDPNETLNIEFANTNTLPYPYNRSDLQPGDLIIGTSWANNYYRASGACRLYFSDTENYIQFQPKTDATSTDPQASSEFAQHTWDTTRDIVINDVHYRWIVVCYGSYNNATSNSDYLRLDCTQLNVVDFVYTNNYNTRYINLPKIIERVKCINQFGDYAATTGNTTQVSFNAYNTQQTNNYLLFNAYYLEWEDIPGQTINGFSPVNQNVYCPRLQTVIIPFCIFVSRDSNSPILFESRDRIFNLTYVRIRQYKLETRTGSNQYAFQYGRYNVGVVDQLSNVKYLICDDEAQANETLCTRFPQFPNIVESNVLEYVTTLTPGYENNQYGMIGYWGVRKGELYLPNVTTISSNYCLNYCRCKIIRLPKYEQSIYVNQNGFSSIPFEKLVLGTTSWSNNSYLVYGSNFMDLRVVELPYLTTLDSYISYNSNAGNQYQYWSTSPMYLDVSALETMSNANGLNCVCWGYINFKEGIKFDIYLDRLTRASKECFTDLFNKIGTLEQGESYTIKLPTKYKYALTTDEIAVATNKGWTVTFA